MATRLPAGLTDRIKAILLHPRTEWDRIDAERMTERGIMTGWVLPLAAIGPIAGLIGALVFGYGAFAVSYRPTVGFAVTSALLGYVLAVFGTWVLARVIDALAPRFGGVRSGVQAMKVAAFASTASYLAGVFQIVPALGILGMVGLYSLYLLYLGIPKLMRAPADRAGGYAVLTCVAAVLIMIVAGALASTVAFRLAGPSSVGGTLSVAGLGTTDLAGLEAASKRVEARTRAMEDGTVKIVEPAVLAAMLPASAGGWTRTEVESQGGGAGGIGGSRAAGVYTAGEDRVTLSVSDMAAMGALATLGGAFNVQSSKITADGYERTGQVDGRLTTEQWSNGERRGKYSTIVGERFVVEAEGRAPSMEALKGLVGTIDADRLEGMAD